MTCQLCDGKGYLNSPAGRIPCDLCHPPKPRPRAGTEKAYQKSVLKQKPQPIRRKPRAR